MIILETNIFGGQRQIVLASELQSLIVGLMKYNQDNEGLCKLCR